MDLIIAIAHVYDIFMDMIFLFNFGYILMKNY